MLGVGRNWEECSEFRVRRDWATEHTYMLWTWRLSLEGRLWNGASVKELPWWLRQWRIGCNIGDPGSIPGSGRSPRDENDYSLQYSCLDNSMNRGAWKLAWCHPEGSPPEADTQDVTGQRLGIGRNWEECSGLGSWNWRARLWDGKCESIAPESARGRCSRQCLGHTHSSSPQVPGHVLSQALPIQDWGWECSPGQLLPVQISSPEPQGLEESDSATKVLWVPPLSLTSPPQLRASGPVSPPPPTS